jgi:hypothetical protein
MEGRVDSFCNLGGRRTVLRQVPSFRARGRAGPRGGERCHDRATGPVTCAVIRNDREDVADQENVTDQEDVTDQEQVADRKDVVDIWVLEIETKIAFLEIENKDSFLLRVHSFLN